MTTATLYVCTTCRMGRGPAEDPPGARLHRALADGPVAKGLRVVGVECLSACDTGCAVALSGPGKWTYVYGFLDPARDVDDILLGAAHYTKSADGLVPWRDRPVIFRKQSLARIPPSTLPESR